MFGGINAASNAATGAPTSLPYAPQTTAGQIGQAALSNVVPSLLSGGSAGIGTRLASGMAGGAGGQAYANVNPDDYWGRLAASLASALAGGLATQGTGAAANLVTKPFAAQRTAEQTVGRELAASPPVPAWPGGPLVSGRGAVTPAVPSIGSALSDTFSTIAGAAPGFALEHLFGGMGGRCRRFYRSAGRPQSTQGPQPESSGDACERAAASAERSDFCCQATSAVYLVAWLARLPSATRAVGRATAPRPAMITVPCLDHKVGRARIQAEAGGLTELRPSLAGFPSTSRTRW
jgi:hypothetical protein